MHDATSHRRAGDRVCRPVGTDPAFRRATVLTGVALLVTGTLGTFALRHWGRVPLSVPSDPYYFAFPFYIFPGSRISVVWAFAAVPVAVAVTGAVVALHRTALAWPVRLALAAALAAILTLAVSTLAGGPHAWAAPFAYGGEYPLGVGRVGAIPAFLRDFPALLPSLPFQAKGHPAGAMVLYAVVARVHPGLIAAALATVAIGSLGALSAGSLARDELGDEGGRLALAMWVLTPEVVLYLATSADAIFATVLGAAALAAHRGLLRRSAIWTAVGGVLLWLGSMLTYAAVLLLVFLGVRAVGQLTRGGCERAWVVRWAGITIAVVLGLAASLRLTTGYDVPAALRAVHGAYQAAPGSAHRSLLEWIPGDIVAFCGMLGVPIAAALAVRAAGVVRERSWTSIDAAAFATLLAAAFWGFTKGEVERIFQFLVPLLLIPATRQLLIWRARVPMVAVLLTLQALAVQWFFTTRW